MRYSKLTLLFLALSLGCSGSGEPAPNGPLASVTETTLAPTRVLADASGARSLILFGEEDAEANAPGIMPSQATDETSPDATTSNAATTQPPSEPVPGSVFKIDEDGNAVSVFDRSFYFETLAVGGESAYLDLGGPLYLDADLAEADAAVTQGVWCRLIGIRVTNATSEGVCLDDVAGIETCLDPDSPDAQTPGGPCDVGIPFGAVGADGVIWIVRVEDLLQFKGSIRAVVGDTSYLATPIDLEGIDVFETMPGGLLVRSDDGIEVYYFDVAADQIRFERYDSDVGLYKRAAEDPSLGKKLDAPRWGDRIMLESEPVNVDNRRYRFLDTTSRAVTSPLQFVPALTDDDLLTGDGFTDGDYFYAKSLSDSEATYWRCTITDMCSPVNTTDATRLDNFFPDSAAAGNIEYGDGGGIGWAVGTDRAYFAANGVISEDLSNDLVIREINVLGGRIYLYGVDADSNEGGLFSVQFNETAQAFEFELLDTFGLEIVELVNVVVPD